MLHGRDVCGGRSVVHACVAQTPRQWLSVCMPTLLSVCETESGIDAFVASKHYI
jgi:hypothetical protein